MRKIIFQGLVLVASFFGVFWGLKQIDWVSLFRADQWSAELEKKLGDLFWKAYSLDNDEITNKEAVSTFTRWVDELCSANGLDPEDFKLHLLKNEEVNAFALPDGHLVIYSGLIQHATKPEAFLGVVCHEMAHIQLAHVRQKLIKEVGLSVLISMATGNGQPQAVQAALKVLSSTAFDRNLERDADKKAVEYLLAAGYNPAPFADFMESLAGETSEWDQYFNWVSTHPSSDERADDIRKQAAEQSESAPKTISPEEWQRFQEQVR